MQTVTTNARVQKFRREFIGSREYYVAPVTMIMPGVLPGSAGPGLYPPQVVTANAHDWDGMPVTVNHPMDPDGRFRSARHPEFFGRSWVGTVLNATGDSGKLTGEVWIDVENANRIDRRLVQAIRSGKEIEVSTGLTKVGVKEAPEGAVHNQGGLNIPYTWEATELHPDHLAILLDEKGACSVADGCGINVANMMGMGYSDIHKKLSEKLTERHPPRQTPDGEMHPRLIEIYDDQVIYHHGDKLWSLGWNRGQDDQITLSEEQPVAVERHTMYMPVTNNTDDTSRNEEAKTMELTKEQRAEKISFLVANCDCWKDSETLLANMDDATLAHTEKVGKASIEQKKQIEELVANSQKQPAPAKPEAKPEPRQETAPKTFADWMKEAPKEVQVAVTNAYEITNRERVALVNSILAPIAEDDPRRASTEAKLKDMDLETLRALAPLGEVANKEEEVQLPNFFGASTPPVTNRKTKPAGDPLPLPELSFERSA